MGKTCGRPIENGLLNYWYLVQGCVSNHEACCGKSTSEIGLKKIGNWLPNFQGIERKLLGLVKRNGRDYLEKRSDNLYTKEFCVVVMKLEIQTSTKFSACWLCDRKFRYGKRLTIRPWVPMSL